MLDSSSVAVGFGEHSNSVLDSNTQIHNNFRIASHALYGQIVHSLTSDRLRERLSSLGDSLVAQCDASEPHEAFTLIKYQDPNENVSLRVVIFIGCSNRSFHYGSLIDSLHVNTKTYEQFSQAIKACTTSVSQAADGNPIYLIGRQYENTTEWLIIDGFMFEANSPHKQVVDAAYKIFWEEKQQN